MIKILPLKDNGMLAKLNDKEKTNANLAYCVYVTDEIEGYILYTLNSNEGRIEAVNAPEDCIFDGLVRAVFGSLYDFGINRAVFSDKIDIASLQRLKLTDSGSLVTSSIEKILYHCANCKK